MPGVRRLVPAEQQGELPVGELIYEPGESLRLELVGRFRRDPNEAFNLESVPTILGELSNQYVTLYQCERTNLSVNIPGKGRSVFQPRFALFGAHDKSLEQPDVSCLIVRIPELEEWLLRCGLSGLRPACTQQRQVVTNSAAPCSNMSHATTRPSKSTEHYWSWFPELRCQE
ncbi:MAG: hypothetical protein IPN02_14430 [Candidatus Microthrix sp.]|uniref:ApeA N-terminal domain-containing protein n=1 Tax=Candidatus Neomicrothrix subdominans TaxID=2954438 RepID=A0A936NE87_9ACTN|nr:hypothetical protein [Candidatus Microthrix subdominans]